MWWLSQKNALSVFLLFFLGGCGSITIGDLDELTAQSISAVAVIDASGRSGQIYTRALERSLYAKNQSTPRYSILSVIKITSSSALSVRGATSTFKKMSMVVNFTVSSQVDKEVVLRGSVATDTTLGTVSSLFSQDQSESHARDRMAMLLAQRVVQKLQLFFNDKKNYEK